MTNKEIMAVYLKAYTSKKAADDSVADDIAVGAGSGFLGWLTGRAVGAHHGEKLRKPKDLKIEHALNRIGARRSELKFKSRDVMRDLLYHTGRLERAKNKGLDTSEIESTVRKHRDMLDKLQQSSNRNHDRYLKTWDKAYKLQKVVKKFKRVGGAAGAVGASLLGTLLYNKLKRD